MQCFIEMKYMKLELLLNYLLYIDWLIGTYYKNGMFDMNTKQECNYGVQK